ncbi:MAG: amidase [Aerococcaceae bacterium]|nr:amidase [Aerococcaceae bacterium]
MLFTQDALHYAQAIKQGRVTVLELVERALHNIEQLNPTLNAVSVVQAQSARELAAQYDAHFQTLSAAQKEQLPTFWGVPILLKDLGQHQAGERSTEGSALFQDFRSAHTDCFVQAIEAAGFVVVGRTNTPEFGFKNISDSHANGAVNLPLDVTRNAGGSSGGAAAALSAGIVPIVTASDGGGSIRIPASFNGLIGLKPSRGRIPVGKGSYRGWQGSSVNFALTKSVRDTWELLKCLQTEQYEAPFMVPKIPQTTLCPLDRPLRIAYSTQPPIDVPVSERAIQAVQQTVERLRQLGHIVVEAAPNIDGKTAWDDYFVVNGVETAAMFYGIEQQLQRPLTVNDVEWTTWAIYQLGLSVSAVDYSRLLARYDKLSAQLHDFYDTFDVWLVPSASDVAPLHQSLDMDKAIRPSASAIEQLTFSEKLALIWKMFDKGMTLTPFNFLQNIAGQPSISLPTYTAPNGLPIGAQFSAAKGQEYVLLQLAQQLGY